MTRGVPPTHLLPRALVIVLLSLAPLAAACESSGVRDTDGALEARDRKEPSDGEKGPVKTEAAAPASAPGDSSFSAPARVPREGVAIARVLTENHDALDRAIRTWLRGGADQESSLVRRIEHLALFQQKTYRVLARDPRAGRRVVRLVPPRLRPVVHDIFTAGWLLSRGLEPVKPPIKLKTYEPEPPHALIRHHRTSARRSGIPWEVLAAVNLIESRFGRVLGPSSAGALGPMQFLPSTWTRYGKGGDINDARDSIMAAGRFLRAHGGLSDMRGALYSYNNSEDYVSAVLAYAGVMARNPISFYSFYNWQVFVRTTRGDVQLTGPGADR